MESGEEKELQRLVNKYKLEDLKRYPFWTAEVYSFGKYIRQYGYYPSFLPLCIQTDHSPTQVDKPVKGHLNNKAPVQFFHSQRLVDVTKTLTNIPCYSLYSPSVFYRRKNKIEKSPEARGTLAFPSHSTHHIDTLQDYEKYIQELLKLPAEFQPVSVCMYFLDIKKGHHKIFKDYNIPVYTAGDWLDPEFTERFYGILRKFQYSTSNSVGSYLFYSVEMGIPFFLYGAKPEYKKSTDADISYMGNRNKNELCQRRMVEQLFSPIRHTISTEQKILVEDELGINTGLSRHAMARVLYSSLFKYYWKNIIAMRIKRKLSFLISKIRPTYVI